MIQRLQSIWLVLAAICGFALTQVPLFIGRLTNNMVKKIIATESLLLFAISVGVACLAAACIFLYKNRPLQFKLSVVGVVLSILVVCLEVWYVEQFKASTQMVR